MSGAADTTGPPATILIADDHVATRVGARIALQANGFEAVAEVATADDAVAAALAHKPQICLVADHIPGDVIAAIKRISTILPQTKIAILASSESPFELVSAVLAGADGYVLKTVDPERLPATLRALLDDQVVVPRALTAALVSELRRRNGSRGVAVAGDGTVLTDREAEVMALMREGMTTAAMADRLRISPVTVRRHISTSLQKLGERDRSSAVTLLAGAAMSAAG
ncbi:MAG: response regulator transcription factor [Solirubrobacteraceae bacterium]|jgi:DNA-binding NarL/FixJ family response regulator